MSDLIRMQDADGRGPWKPGFSIVWTDPHGPQLPAPVTSAIPNFRSFVMGLHRKGLNIGCAVRQRNVSKWFTPAEVAKLAELGYHWHDASRCDVVWENEDQALIATRVNLRKLPRLDLDGVSP